MDINMEIQDIQLPSIKKTISVIIERKNVKSYRLKVYPDARVSLSVPYSASIDSINEFLNSKNIWIENKLEKFCKTIGYAATTEIQNGMSIKLLGEDLVFSIIQSDKNIVYNEGKILYVCSIDVNNQEKLFRLFEIWWRNKSLEIIDEEMKKLYPIIKKYGVPYPKIKIRKMKTLWGSCSVQKGIVTFNQYLIKAKLACIEYIVLHELVHFIYPNHSKQFYMFLSNYMPDWKERKKVLDQDVVHGL